jgi:hypothetical protein
MIRADYPAPLSAGHFGPASTCFNFGKRMRHSLKVGQRGHWRAKLVTIVRTAMLRSIRFRFLSEQAASYRLDRLWTVPDKVIVELFSR